MPDIKASQPVTLFLRGNSSAPEVHGLLDAVFLRQKITRKEKTTRSGFRLLDRLHAPLEARGMNQSQAGAISAPAFFSLKCQVCARLFIIIYFPPFAKSGEGQGTPFVS